MIFAGVISIPGYAVYAIYKAPGPTLREVKKQIIKSNSTFNVLYVPFWIENSQCDDAENIEKFIASVLDDASRHCWPETISATKSTSRKLKVYCIFLLFCTVSIRINSGFVRFVTF